MLRPDIIYSSRCPSGAAAYTFYVGMGWEPGLGRTPAQLASALRGSWYLACAWDGDRLVGMVRALSDGGLHAFLCGLGVLPGHRGQGIGKALAELAVKRCLEAGMRPQLLCEDALAPFYRRMGFEPFLTGMKHRGNL